MFGQSKVRIGSTAVAGALQLLPLVICEKRTCVILMTVDLLYATVIGCYGFINWVVNDGVDAKGTDLLQQVLNHNSLRTIA